MPNTDGLRRVDNILKMLLGVLSIAGLIALVIPEKNPVPERSLEGRPGIEAPAESMPPPPPPISQPPMQFDSAPPSNFQIGAPSIDGNPMQPDFGMPFGVSAQTSSSTGDTNQNNQGGFTPPAYTMPGSSPPQPEGAQLLPTVESMPVPAQNGY